MIPFTFPSSPSLVTGNAECKIFYLSSVTGLAAWKDYIPVRSYTSSAPVEGATDAAGYQAVKPLSSTTGLAAWTDYVPVYEDASLTKPWSTDAGGYIPVGAAGSRLSLNFAGTTAIDSRVTFTRGSGGGYFGSDGLYKWQGYNLLTQSVDYTNAVYATVTTGATAVASTDTPLSGVLAAFIKEDTSTGGHMRGTGTGAASGAGDGARTVSGYFKAAGRTRIRLESSGNAAGASGARGVFDLTGAGSVVTTSVIGTPAATSQSGTITLVGNGWYRCTLTYTPGTTGNTACSFLPQLVDTGTNTSYTGDGVSGVIVAAPQVETGSTANQYSPTTTAANSAPRLDYDPATLLPRGLLVEEQRTNLIPNSNGFNNNGAISAATFAQNAVDPAGTSTAWTITESATSANQYGIATNNGSATLTAAVHTASAFVKAGTNTRCQLCVSSSLSTDYANFLLTGSGSVTAATTPANCTIVALAGGWYRITMVFTSLASTGSVVVSHINTGTDARIPLYLGTSRTLIAFGAQLELGSTPSSYIPTTTAAATRSADSASMTGTNFSSWYSQTQGTFVVEGDVPFATGVASRYIDVNDGTGGNTIIVAQSTSLAGNIFLSGVAQATFAGTVSTSVVKSALAYATNDAAYTYNGTAIQTDATVTLPTVSRMDIGFSTGTAGRSLNGHIRRIQYYPTRLPNATLQALTA